MKLTAEQKDVVKHDPDKHARVLAVAGSGKTTTVVHRIKHLVEALGVPHRGVRAVMYNVSARKDFEEKLKSVGVSGVQVQTFHALGWNVLIWAADKGFTDRRRLIKHDKDVLELVDRSIRNLRSSGTIHPTKVIDKDEARTAISTWKAMLTGPDHAKHLLVPEYVDIYAEFEKLRASEGLCTFDDQIYDAVRLLEDDEHVRSKLENRLEHLIIDEFQDVNYARFRLASILAGTRARLMIVGDDDQCIYEWQGSRSSFIKREFEVQFRHHPHSSYKLTRSFRFGPAIAQIASNVISRNTDRVEKELVAADLNRPSQVVTSFSEDDGESGGGNHQAIPIIERLASEGVPRKETVVLVRKYSQSFLIQSFLLAKGIPFVVTDGQPLIKAFPIRLAIAYLEAAEHLDRPIDQGSSAALGLLLNRPKRYVKVDAFERFMKEAQQSHLSLAEGLTSSDVIVQFGVNREAADRLGELESKLRNAVSFDLQSRAPGIEGTGSGPNSGQVLESLMRSIPFADVFREYRGASATEDDVSMMRALAVLLREAKVPLPSVQEFLKGLDPTQGKPPDQCLMITTLFKAKGLEWDHVLLPDLVEGQCPDLRVVVNACVNKEDSSRNFEPTETLESERRLFYVAVTRARKAVYLFADASERALLSRFIHEAFIEQTVDAIDAVQALLKSKTRLEGPIRRIISAAKAYDHLRNGLLRIIRLASEDGEAPKASPSALSLVTGEINSIRSMPFSYPQAYPDPQSPKAKVTFEDDDTGLPF